MYKLIDKCRICGNSNLIQVLDLGDQALTGIFPRARSQFVPRSPLQLVKCTGTDACGLLQLRHTYDLGEMYGQNYGYRSGLNQSMVEHLHRKVAGICRRVDWRGQPLIIDIGSNDSTTLQAYPRTDCTLVGVDPTGVKFRNFYPDHIQLLPNFFSAGLIREHFAGRKARIVTSFSMFYDLEDPLQFMRDIADVLDERGLWVFEQSYMPAMLEHNSYDTVCHEHLEYYALKQIAWMAARVGLKLIDVEFNDVNGGSFSITASLDSAPYPVSSVVAEILQREIETGMDTLAPYAAFAKRVEQSRTELMEFLTRQRAAGKRVVGLGASTKGNVLLQYCGLTEQHIDSIAEVNADKFGAFTPGSLIPIRSQEELLSENPDYLMVLPWHFRTFFEKSKKLSGRHLVFPLPRLEVITV